MTNSKPATTFWIIAGIALLWNFMGLGAFISDVMSTPESLAATYTTEQLELINTYPAWTKIFYGLATICGTLGCIALILRKKWALPLFWASLLGVVVQQVHSIFMTDAVSVFGTTAALVFPLLIFVIACILVWYTKSSIAKGILN